MPGLGDRCDVRKQPVDCGVANAWCEPSSETSVDGVCACLSDFGYTPDADGIKCELGRELPCPLLGTGTMWDNI